MLSQVAFCLSVLFVVLFSSSAMANEEASSYVMRPIFTVGDKKHIACRSTTKLSIQGQSKWQMTVDGQSVVRCTEVSENNGATFKAYLKKLRLHASSRNKKVQRALRKFCAWFENRVRFRHVFTISVNSEGEITGVDGFESYAKRLSDRLNLKKMAKSKLTALRKSVRALTAASAKIRPKKAKKIVTDKKIASLLKKVQKTLFKTPLTSGKYWKIERERQKGTMGFLFPLFYGYPKKSLESGTEFSIRNGHTWQVVSRTKDEVKLQGERKLYKNVRGSFIENPYPSLHSGQMYTYIPGYKKRIGKDKRTCIVDVSNGFIKKETSEISVKDKGGKGHIHQVIRIR